MNKRRVNFIDFFKYKFLNSKCSNTLISYTTPIFLLDSKPSLIQVLHILFLVLRKNKCHQHIRSKN